MNGIGQHFFKIASIVLLWGCTVWFFNHYPRYQAVGAEILGNADFLSGLALWQPTLAGVEAVSEPDGGVKLSANDSGQSVSVSQFVTSVSPGSLLRLACEIKTDHVSGGEKPYETARIALFSFDSAGQPMYYRPHALIHQTGSHDWLRAERVFEIGDDVAKIQVAAQLTRSTGEFWVRSCSLRPVALKTAFNDYRFMLLCAWLVLALWVVVPFVRLGFKSWAHVVVMVLSAGIVLGVLMPERLKDSVGNALWQDSVKTPFSANGLNDVQTFSWAPALPAIDVFKIGHFVMFGLLAATLVTGRPYRISKAGLVFYLALFAAVSEVLQLFMAGRNPQLGDVIVDCLGIGSGLFLAGVWSIFTNRQRGKSGYAGRVSE